MSRLDTATLLAILRMSAADPAVLDLSLAYYSQFGVYFSNSAIDAGESECCFSNCQSRCAITVSLYDEAYLAVGVVILLHTHCFRTWRMRVEKRLTHQAIQSLHKD
eukprot:708-Heterococcus_DN1.PRE.3